MDGRTRVVLGGGSAFVVAAVMLGSVLATNAAALADSPGRSIQSPRVDITAAPRVAPATPAPSATPNASPAPRSDTHASTETVTAPAPVIVASRADHDAVRDASSMPEHTPDLDEVLAAFAAEDWGLVAAWADEYGWSGAQIREWFRTWKGEPDTRPSHSTEQATDEEPTELRENHGDDRRSWSKPGDDAGSMPAPSGITSRDGRSAQRDGVEGRSLGSPDRRD